MFFTLSKREIILLATIYLSSAIAFNLITSKILLFGKGLIKPLSHSIISDSSILIKFTRHNSNVFKMVAFVQECLENRLITLGEEEKNLNTSILSFSHNVFNKHLYQGFFLHWVNKGQKSNHKTIPF